MARQIVNTKVSGDISERAATYLTNMFRTKHAGLLYVLQVFPALHQNYVKALKGVFTNNELCLIVEAFWDYYLLPEMAGEQLTAKVKKAIVLGKKNEKWGVQPKGILKKISKLPFPSVYSWKSGQLSAGSEEKRIYLITSTFFPKREKEFHDVLFPLSVLSANLPFFSAAPRAASE